MSLSINSRPARLSNLLPAEFLQRKGFSFLLLSLSLSAGGDRYLAAIMYSCVTLSTKKFTLFYWIGDFPVCLSIFVLLVLPVPSLHPATLPSDLGTTTRESPKPPVLEGRPRCIGRDFDEIFQAAWLVPPWTCQAACGSSQTFSHPFPDARPSMPHCPMALHVHSRYASS